MSAVLVTRLAAWFGSVGGGAPSYANPPSEEWNVDRIDESDPAHPVAYLSRALETFAVDRASLFQTRQVHVWACDISKETDDPDYRVTPLFAGEVTSNSINIQAGETEVAVAKINRFHYGVPLEGETVWDAENEETFLLHRDARFNPTIDAKVTGNMAPDRDGHASMPATHNLWLDPESSRTDEAVKLHDQTTAASKWSLGLAVETLQRVLNGAQTLLKNTTIFTDPFTAEPPFDDAADPENVTLKRGMYLDQCLRQLLPQYGCGFFVACQSEGSGANKSIRPEIRYYQRGVGSEKDVKLQQPATPLDADDTNCLQAQITYDVANVNRVVVHGGRTEREVTLELVKGWDEDDDSLDVDDLTRGGDDSQFDDKPHVHRLWVANEDGSYNGSRTEITEALDLSSVFEEGYVPRRRKLYPPLTYRNQAPTETAGLRGPVKVEYTTVADPTDSDWEDVTGETANARFIVLEDQIGIYFNQPAPPAEFVDNEADLKMRVTGTIVGDQCLIGEADVPAWAPNTSPVTLIINAEDRFFDRQRQATGDHTSALTGEHDNRDDASAITSFAETMRDQAAAANVAARITLSGIVTDYAISDLLTGISGRGISFNRSGDPLTPLYVQVVGRQFDGNQQTTTLIVAPYDVPLSRGGTV